MHRWSPLASASAVALLACGTFTAVAVAATINGNNADNVLVGTSSADVMNGKGGSDNIYGNGGDDFLDGGAGGDFADYNTIHGLSGGSGSDRLSGVWGPRPERGSQGLPACWDHGLHDDPGEQRKRGQR